MPALLSDIPNTVFALILRPFLMNKHDPAGCKRKLVESMLLSSMMSVTRRVSTGFVYGISNAKPTKGGQDHV